MPRKSHHASLAGQGREKHFQEVIRLAITLLLPQVVIQSPGIRSISPRAEAISSEQELNIYICIFSSGRHLHFVCIAFLQSEVGSRCALGETFLCCEQHSLGLAWLHAFSPRTGQPAAKPQSLQTVTALYLMLFRKMK